MKKKRLFRLSRTKQCLPVVMVWTVVLFLSVFRRDQRMLLPILIDHNLAALSNVGAL